MRTHRARWRGWEVWPHQSLHEGPTPPRTTGDGHLIAPVTPVTPVTPGTQVVKQMAPWPIPKVPWWRATFTSSMVFGMLMIAIFGILLPQNTTLIATKDAMCAGDTEFVYAVGAVGSPAWSYPAGLRNWSQHNYSRPWPSRAGEAFTFPEYVVDAVLQGKGLVDCPALLCYNLSAAGVPPPLVPFGDLCCLAEQTKQPATYKVEGISIETISAANDMCAPCLQQVTARNAMRAPWLQQVTVSVPAAARTRQAPPPHPVASESLQ